MMPYKHEIGDVVNLAFEITSNSVGVTAQTPVVAVQRISDSQWLNATKDGWQAGYNDIALTELDATNLPGVYGTDVTQFGGAAEKWRVRYKNTGTYAGIDTEVHEFTIAVAKDSTVAKEATLANGTYGLSALNTDLDTLLVRATELRLAELDPANIPTDIAAVKGDTAAILDDTGTNGVVVASGSKAGYSLAADQSSVTVGTVNALGTQAKADVNAEVDSALNTAIPGSPTADSINQRIKAIDDLTQAAGAGDLAAILVDTSETQTKLPTNFIMGSTVQTAKDDEIDAILTTLTVPTFTIVTDGLNNSMQFKTNLASVVDDFYKGIWIRAQTGALVGAAPHKVSTYNGTTKILTLTNTFVSTPAAGDIFEIISE